jgi:copper(I)-binding protein
MKPFLRAFAGVPFALALCNFSTSAAPAAETHAGNLVLRDGWVRVPPKGAHTGAAYLTIVNDGDSEDRLTGGKTDAAAILEVHEMKMDKGVMSMRAVQGGLALPPRSETRLKPGGYHLMLIGLKTSIAAGDDIVMTLHFARAGEVTVHLPAREASAMQGMRGMMRQGRHH